jgi:peptidoglycan LD-endopeptidase LytH
LRGRSRFSKSNLGRAAAVLVVVLVAGSLATGAGATTKQQLTRAKATLHRIERYIHNTRIRLHDVKREVHQTRLALRALQARLNDLAVRTAAAEAAFEGTRTQVDTTKKDLAKAQAEYAALRDRIDQRARILYEQGPGSDLEFLFSASSLSDLSDRMEFVGAVNAEDASLALQVQRVADALRMKKAQLVVLEQREQRQLTALRGREALLNGKFGEQQQLLNQLGSRQQQAASLLSNLATRRTRLENLVGSLNAALARQARLAAARAGRDAQTSHFSGGEPVSLGHPFSYCPVQGPHAYSDDFGAPRYTTNPPHPHAGNDIFSPRGTPIVAPFDGYASNASGGLGGMSVIVTGSQGYVYNAHLDHIGTLGSVSAGTVVGYVGNTGDAAGGATHDHFEWHPSPVPSQLWRSPYGYTDINGAVDPFPYLNQVC